MSTIEFWVRSIGSVFSLSALKQSFCMQDGRLAGHPERACRLFRPANRKRSDAMRKRVSDRLRKVRKLIGEVPDGFLDDVRGLNIWNEACGVYMPELPGKLIS